MKVRPFRLLGARDLDLLKQGVGRVLDEWTQAWLPPDAVDASVDAVSAFGSIAPNRREREWKTVSVAGAGWCAFGFAPDLHGPLGAILLTDDRLVSGAPGELVSELATMALSDLALRLMGREIDNASTPFEEHEFLKEAAAPGSGCAWLDFEIGPTALPVVLSSEALTPYLQRSETEFRPGLAPPAQRQESLQNQKMRVRVRLGSADLAIEALATLRIGDVIRLENRIDEPATLMLDDEATTCKGFLGKRAGKLALRLADTSTR